MKIIFERFQKNSIFQKKKLKDLWNNKNDPVIIYKIKNSDKYIHKETNLVFHSPTNQKIIGRYNNNKIIKLGKNDIKLCKKMEFQNRDLKSIIKYKMTDSLNNTLKTLQNKVTQISTEPNVSTTPKSQGLISIVKSMYLYIIILILCILVALIWLKPAFIMTKDDEDEDTFDKVKLAGLTMVISSAILGGAYWYFYMR